MSGAEVIALTAVVVSGIVGVSSLGFNFWNSHQDRRNRLRMQQVEHEESYRAGLYEKRLEIHQRAFTWTQDLGRRAYRVESHISNVDEFATSNDEFRDWLTLFNLYLDPVSQHQLTKLLTQGREFVLKRKTYSEFSAQVEATQSALVKGIALKHIDFEAIKDDLRAMREESP